MKKLMLAALAAVGLVATSSAAMAGYYVPTCGWVRSIWGPVWVCD